MVSALRVAVVDRPEELALLGPEWDELHRSAPGTTPFQSWTWMTTWWAAYGAGRALRVVTLRDGDRLVGLVPLALTRRRGLGVLEFLGTRRNDYQDVLARGGWEDRVVEAVLPALRTVPGWQVADLHQLRPGSVGWRALRHGRAPRLWVDHEGSPRVAVRPWEDVVAALSRNQRSTVRRTVRRAEAEGIVAVAVPPQEAEQAGRRLVELHRELWRDRGMTAEHGTPRWAEFLASAVARTVAAGEGAVTEFRRDGRVLMSVFWLTGPGFVGFYHAGVGREMLEQYQWNALLVRDGLVRAGAVGASHVDLLRGEQRYKLQWASDVLGSSRVLLGRGPVRWALYAGAVGGQVRLTRYVLSDRCPAPVRDGLRRAKALVAGARRVVTGRRGGAPARADRSAPPDAAGGGPRPAGQPAESVGSAVSGR